MSTDNKHIQPHLGGHGPFQHGSSQHFGTGEDYRPSDVWPGPMSSSKATGPYLSPVQDPKPASTAEEVMQKLEKKLLSHSNSASIACEPKNSPTRLLVAALWLCLRWKYINKGTAKDACTLFNILPKSLSNIMLGKRYAGGTARGKLKQSHTAAHEGDVAGEDIEPPAKK